MRGTRRTLPLALLLALSVPAASLAQATASPPAAKPEEAPAFKISGLVYGDYYYVAASHRDELEDQNGFWIRRLYFTYDHTLSKALSLRVRLEANSKGDFESTGVNTPYVKDAWLKWTFGAHALTFGLAPTPNIDFVDAFQGYRSVEKSPIDLYRWDSSRDLGLLVQGGLGEGEAHALLLPARQRLRDRLRDGREQGGARAARAPLRGRPRPRGLRRLAGPPGRARRLDARGPRGLAGEGVARVAPVRAPGAARVGARRLRPRRSTSCPPSPSVQVTPRVALLGARGPQLRPDPGRRDDRLHAVLRPGEVRRSASSAWTSRSRRPSTSSRTSRRRATTRRRTARRPGTDVVPRVTLFFSW